jgi:hypothetical protein
LRSETFGPKGFDSLYQTGEHALGSKELKILQNDGILLLPKDAEGCPVLSIDCSCLEKKKNWIQARDRCLFYMFSLLAEDTMSQTEGAVLLYKMDSPPSHSLVFAFLERLANSLPLRFKAVHLLSHEPISHKVESQISFGDETYVHVGSSNDQLASQLEEFGLNKAGLPKCLNGKWGLSQYFRWQELRTRMEWRTPLGFSGRDYSKAFGLPGMRLYTLHPEKAERDRRLNVIHCRRKRDQKRIELEVLEEECSELREIQDTLLEENRRLEDRVRVAIETVERGEREQGDTRRQSDRISTQTSEQGSYSLSGDTKLPKIGYDCDSMATAVSPSFIGKRKRDQPLQGQRGEPIQALRSEDQMDQIILPGTGVDPLRQGPAMSSAYVDSMSAQTETSSSGSAFVGDVDYSLLLAAEGLLKFGS